MNFPLKYDVHPPNVGFNDPTFDGTKWCLTGATFLGYPVPLCEAKKKGRYFNLCEWIDDHPPKMAVQLVTAHIKTVLWD